MTHLTYIKAGSNSKQVALFVGEGVRATHILRPLHLAKQLKQENDEVHFACDSNFKKLRASESLNRLYDEACLLNGEQDDDIWNLGKGNRVERVMNLDEEPALSIQS